MPKINLTIRVEPELRARLDYVAERIGANEAEAVRVALIDYIARWEAANERIPKEDTDHRAAEWKEE